MILYLYNLRYVLHVITIYIPLPNKCVQINHHFQKIHRRKNRVVVVKIFRSQEKRTTIMINDDIQENRKKTKKNVSNKQKKQKLTQYLIIVNIGHCNLDK